MQQIPLGITSTLYNLFRDGRLSQPIQELWTSIFNAQKDLQRMQTSAKSSENFVRAFYDLIDELLAPSIASEPISCRKGCAFCCKINVDTTPLEVRLILAYTREKNIPIDTNYLRAQSAIDKEQLRFNRGLSACVFLQPDNTCAIYAVRPLACRKYFVASPPARCDVEHYPEADQDVMIDVGIEVLISAFDSLQFGKIDGLHKLLLRELTGEP